MIIYEIDISVNKAVYDEYIHWLKKHISIMLSFEGFNDAQIYVYKKNKYKKHLLVHYYVSTIDHLNVYLERYSKEMRTEGMKKFTDSIEIKRRILTKI